MPKKSVDKSQAYFWTRKWQEGEREADEDIKAGRVKTFNTVDELIEIPVASRLFVTDFLLQFIH